MATPLQTSSAHLTVPTFALYGEQEWQAPAGFGHMETIASRSRLHDWVIAPHRHDRAIQVLLIRQGRAWVTLDGVPFDLSDLSFIVVPADVIHGFRFFPGTEGYVLTLSSDFARRGQSPGDPLGHLLSGGGNGVIAPQAAAQVGWLASRLEDMAAAAPVANPLFDALAEALLRTLDAGAGGPRYDRRLALFRHLVETHLAEHRDLHFYATSIGTTVRTLNRLCRTSLGAPPQALINRRLALEAQRLLRYSGCSVAEAADRLGFQDVSYFSRFYKRATGQRPSAERQVSAG